jgi:hypothetical protein
VVSRAAADTVLCMQVGLSCCHQIFPHAFVRMPSAPRENATRAKQRSVACCAASVLRFTSSLLHLDTRLDRC